MIYSGEQDTAKVAKVILCDPSKMAQLSHFPAIGLRPFASAAGAPPRGSAAADGDGLQVGRSGHRAPTGLLGVAAEDAARDDFR